MGKTMNCDDARALLQSTQQLRTHWSGVITTRIGFVIVASVAIWSYFLKVYIDSFDGILGTQPLYLLVATIISTILFALWHEDTRRFVEQISLRYADFILYEGLLSVPPEYGTSGYLMSAVSDDLSIILEDKDLTSEQRAKGILMLSKEKHLRGGKGLSEASKYIVFALTAAWVISAIMFLFQNKPMLYIVVLYYIFITIAFVFFFWARCWTSWKPPSEDDISKVMSKLKRKRDTST